MTRAYLFGLKIELMTCFPVQRQIGLIIVGGGKFINSSASQNQEIILVNSSLFKNISLEVNKKEVVKKSCIRATIGYPLFGVTIFWVRPIKCNV